MTIDPFKKLNKGIIFQRKKMDFPGILGEIPRLIFTMNFASNPAKAKKNPNILICLEKNGFWMDTQGKGKKAGQWANFMKQDRIFVAQTPCISSDLNGEKESFCWVTKVRP